MDLFGRQDQVLMGGLSSDSMFVTWPELAAVGGGLGMLIQQVGLEYRQPVRRIFEIGPGVIPIPAGGFGNAQACDGAGGGGGLNPACQLRTQPSYYIVGRPEGRLQFGRFVGPNVLGQCFYRAYGSPCSTNVMSLSGRAGCSASGAANNPQMTWIMNGVLLDNTKMDINGQEMVIQEGIGAMFVGLNVLVNGQDLPCDGGGNQLVGGG